MRRAPPLYQAPAIILSWGLAYLARCIQSCVVNPIASLAEWLLRTFSGEDHD